MTVGRAKGILPSAESKEDTANPTHTQGKASSTEDERSRWKGIAHLSRLVGPHANAVEAKVVVAACDLQQTNDTASQSKSRKRKARARNTHDDGSIPNFLQADDAVLPFILLRLSPSFPALLLVL